MKSSFVSYLPCALAAIALAAFGFMLKRELDTSHRLVEAWAHRNLVASTQLAAESVKDALASDDFARVREFADTHEMRGLRLTVLSAQGGMVFDTDATAMGSHADRHEVRTASSKAEITVVRESSTTNRKMMYCARKVGNDFIVRLALPYDSIFSSMGRNRAAMFLSALIGASGILMVMLFSLHLVAHNRKLAREKAVQARMLEELKRVDQFRRDFIANVSHEIKTPLTGILGVSEMLTSCGIASLSVKDRDDLLNMLKKETSRLDALTRDILSLARLEHDESAHVTDFIPADLGDVLDSAVAAVKPQAEAAGMRVIVEKFGKCVVSCDAQRIEQAIVNLGINAVKHSASPDVLFKLERMQNCVSFSVSDHGIGIAKSDQSRIFERFYRVDKAHSRESGGTGLGLAIVKHVAQLHGGDAAVMSEPGRGCTFTFTIQTQQQTQT